MDANINNIISKMCKVFLVFKLNFNRYLAMLGIIYFIKIQKAIIIRIISTQRKFSGRFKLKLNGISIRNKVNNNIAMEE